MDPIVEIIGEEIFGWLSSNFNGKTTLSEVPDDIIRTVASVDIAVKNYMEYPGSVTTIAFITFAYSLAGRRQMPSMGGKDILLMKVLAKREKDRREGRSVHNHPLWKAPIVELITGEVGERIRNSRCMINSL